MLVSIDEFNKQVESIIKSKNAKVEIENSNRGRVYAIRSDQAVLKITLGNKWVGYELEIPKMVLGREIGSAVDTDNYDLDYDIDVTNRIFDEVKECLKGFLDGRIYIGLIEKKPTLAIPKNNSTYKVISRGRIMGKVFELSNEEIAHIPGFSPVQV